MRLMAMRSSLAWYLSTLIGRVWFRLRLSVAVLPALACVMAWGAPAGPSAPKALLIVGPPMVMDVVDAGVTTPRFVLYSEGVAIFRSGGTVEKPGFRRAQVSPDLMKLFQVYMDDFFLNPEFAEGFQKSAAEDVDISFVIEARYPKGGIEILLRGIRMEEMEYFGTQLHVRESLAQVPVSLIRLLSLVRQVESSGNGKAVSLSTDQKGNPVMPGVVNAAPQAPRSGPMVFGGGSGAPCRLPAAATDIPPVEVPSAKQPELKPEQPAPLVGPESYRK